MKESVGNLIIVGWMVVGCYPTENPLASGGRAGRSPRGGSGTFTCSPGLPRLSTGGLHYTILRFIRYTITSLNTYTSQRANRSRVAEYPNFPVTGSSRGGGGHGHGTWLGGSPLTSRSIQTFPSAVAQGGWRPADPDARLGEPSLPSRSIHTSLSVVAQGGWRPPQTRIRGLGGPPLTSRSHPASLSKMWGGCPPLTRSRNLGELPLLHGVTQLPVRREK